MGSGEDGSRIGLMRRRKGAGKEPPDERTYVDSSKVMNQPIMLKIRLYSWITAGCLALLVTLITACSRTTDSNAALQRFPDVEKTASTEIGTTLVDLDGQDVGLDSDANAVALAIVFILADCPICNSYVKELNRLFEELSDKEVRLVLVHADPAITAEKARQHAREYQIQAPIALDPQHYWVKKAGTTIAPEAAVLSRTSEVLYRGRINDQYAELGKRRTTITSHDLRDALSAIVADRPVAVSRTQAIGCFIPEVERVP